MKQTFYVKKGRNYIPVSEYDDEFCRSMPYGTHISVIKPGSSSHRYKIDPEFGPLIAAGKYAEDKMISALVKASEMRPQQQPLTKEQIEAWENLKKAFKNESFYVQYPSAHDIIQAGLQAMIDEAESTLTNPTVKKAWEKFMFIWQLSRETHE